MILSCPHCGQALTHDPSFVGRPLRCPHCDHDFAMLPIAENAAAAGPEPTRSRLPARFHGIRIAWLLVLASMLILGGLAWLSSLVLSSLVTPTYLVVAILLSPVVGIGIWAAITRPISLPKVDIPPRVRVVLAAVFVVAAFATGAAVTRIAPFTKAVDAPARRFDIVGLVLCAPSYFSATFAGRIFAPFPFSVPFALANGVLYACYAAIAMTPRFRWILLGAALVHGVCCCAIVLLASFSGIKG
jgi:hypothetical protein